MSNVIPFPKEKLNSPPQNMDEVYREVAEAQNQFHTDRALHYTKMIVDQMESSGYSIEDKPETAHVLMMLVETVKAMMVVTIGGDHPMNQLAKKAMTFEEPPQLIIDQFYDITEGRNPVDSNDDMWED